MKKVTKIDTQELQRLGLTLHEAEVYLSLVGKGKVRAGDVIKKTNLHRNLVYQSLESLADRRLVTRTTQGGIFHFQLTDPEHLRDRLREQELVADRLIESLKEQARFTEQEITVYEGEDAIRTFSLKNAANLSPGEHIHVLGSGGKRFEEAMGARALRSYFSQIEKQRGGIRSLAYKRQMYSPDILSLIKKNTNTEIRILPFEMTPSANVVFTNTSVAFQIFEKPYTVVEVRNAHLVEAYRNYFNLLWKQNVRIEQGMEALHSAFYDMVDSMRPGEEYYVLGGNIGKQYSQLSSFFDEYHRYRIQRGITAKILAQHDAAFGIQERNRLQGDPEEKISFVKTFQTPFLIPMQINLFQGRARMILYKEDPVVLYFEDREIYDGFKLYFDEIWNRQAETLHGHEGVIALCEYVLKEEKDLYLIAATGNITKTHSEYYKAFTERRVKKSMRLHVLANNDTRGTGRFHVPLADVKYLPEAFASPMVIWIFGDVVAHVLWHEPETIFMIRDARTASYYRQYYEALSGIATV